MPLDEDGGTMSSSNRSELAKMANLYAAEAQHGDSINSTVGYEASTDLSTITEEPGYYYAGAEGLMT